MKEFEIITMMTAMTVVINKLDNLKDSPFYSGKVKMRGNAFLQELERLDKAITRQTQGIEPHDEYSAAMGQLGGVFDSFMKWVEIWERFIMLPPDKQLEVDTELHGLFTKHNLTN